jgi:hypothetical protein
MRLFDEVGALAGEPGAIERTGEAARKFARPGAAARAADILEELGRAGSIPRGASAPL